MPVTTVGAYEAKTHLPRLLAEVENGDEVVITKHGRPVARLVPIRPSADEFRELVAELRAIRATIPPLDAPVGDLAHEGHQH